MYPRNGGLDTGLAFVSMMSKGALSQVTPLASRRLMPNVGSPQTYNELNKISDSGARSLDVVVQIDLSIPILHRPLAWGTRLACCAFKDDAGFIFVPRGIQRPEVSRSPCCEWNHFHHCIRWSKSHTDPLPGWPTPEHLHLQDSPRQDFAFARHCLRGTHEWCSIQGVGKPQQLRGWG